MGYHKISGMFSRRISQKFLVLLRVATVLKPGYPAEENSGMNSWHTCWFCLAHYTVSSRFRCPGGARRKADYHPPAPSVHPDLPLWERGPSAWPRAPLG